MNKSLVLRPGFWHPLKTALSCLFPTLVYGLILVLPLPQVIGAAVRHGFNLWLLVAGLMLYLGFRLDRSTGWWLSFTPVGLLFGLGLAGLWSNAFSEMQVVSGMLYFSDASQYYSDALRLLNGFPFSSFSARHPLPTLFIALLFWATGKNLQLTLAILVFISAVCVYLAAREVLKAFGPFAASIFTLILFLFYRRFTGLLDSENLGLALGCLSFSFFFLAGSRRKPAPLVGMMLLSLALAARPGAFFILPAALVWFIFLVPGAPQPKLNRAFLGTLVLSSGFTLTYITNALLAEPGSRMYSNLAYTLYGIAQGGKGWEQFESDFPEYARQPAVAAEQFAYQQAAQAFSSHPETALQGLLKSTIGYFSIKDQSLFGFLCGGEITAFNREATPANQIYYRGARLVILALSAVGIGVLWRERKKPAGSLILAVLLGWLFSLPFIPPEDAGMMRVFAATLAFLAILPAAGLAAISYRLGALLKRKVLTRVSEPVKQSHAKSIENQSQGTLSDIHLSTVKDTCAFTLVLLLFMGPLLIKILWATHHPGPHVSTCQPGEMAYMVEISPGSFITLVEDEASAAIRFPDVRYLDYLRSIQGFHRKESLLPLASLPPGSVLMNTLDLSDGLPFWAVLPLSARALTGHELEICGHWHAGFQEIGLGFLVVENLKIAR